jgi:hypothetical protein
MCSSELGHSSLQLLLRSAHLLHSDASTLPASAVLELGHVDAQLLCCSIARSSPAISRSDHQPLWRFGTLMHRWSGGQVLSRPALSALLLGTYHSTTQRSANPMRRTRPHRSRSPKRGGSVLLAFDQLLRLAVWCAHRWVNLVLAHSSDRPLRRSAASILGNLWQSAVLALAAAQLLRLTTPVLGRSAP